MSVEYKHYDQDALVLLMQVARAAGIRAFVPGRSRYRVVVEGTQAQLDAVHKLATELGRALAIGQVKALVGVLEGAGLRVPTYVRKFLGKLQAKDAELSAANGSAEPAHT